MVEKPEDYKWSSFGMYIGDKKEELITSNRILSYFINVNKRKKYKDFVDSKLGQTLASTPGVRLSEK